MMAFLQGGGPSQPLVLAQVLAGGQAGCSARRELSLCPSRHGLLLELLAGASAAS